MKTLHSEQAEQSLLKLIFTSNNYANEIMQIMDENGITHESFFTRKASEVYLGVCCMRDEGIRIGADTFLEVHANNKTMLKYVSESLSGDEPVESHRFYIQIIRDLHMKRQLKEICGDTIAQLKDGNCEQIASDMHTQLCAITTVDQVLTPDIAADSVMHRWEQAKDGISIGIPTPFPEFNRITGGPQRKLLCLLAGRGGMGKSTILSQWYHTLGSGRLSAEPIPCITFCFEDGVERTMARVAGHEGDFSVYKRDMGDSSDNHMAQARTALDIVKRFPITYEERPRTVQQIRSQLTRMKMDTDIQIAFVDGWKDLIDDHHRWDQNRVEKYQSQHLRDTAKLLDIAIVPVHHLTKIDPGITITPENIRGNGLISADARQIIALQNNKEETEFSFDLIKVNFGPRGRTSLRRIASRGVFVEVDEGDTQACNQQADRSRNTNQQPDDQDMLPFGD